MEQLDCTPSLIAITGPTACGKTRMAVALARAVGGEIISADSRQVYQGMDIGTGKDIEEYGSVAVHLVDIRPAGSRYNLYQYLHDARQAIDDVNSRGHQPIVCGGTGLYVESLMRGVALPPVPENPQLRQQLCGKSLSELGTLLGSMKKLHNVTDIDSCQRAIRAIEIETYYQLHPELNARQEVEAPAGKRLVVGLSIDRGMRRQRIARRLEARLDQGMVQEVQGLLDSGIAPDDLIYYGLEYKFLTLYLTGHLPYSQMVDELYTAICQFAKRQMTWFRGMERRGIPIRWLPHDMPTDEFVETVRSWVNQYAF